MADKNIHEKLSALQIELNVPKGQRNDFGNYNYRSCEDIVVAAKPLLDKNGLLLNMTDSIEVLGNRVYVKAVATVVDISTGDSFSATAYAREEETKKGMDAAQITGSASSYARKYALNGLFAIDDVKDPDTNEQGKQTGGKPTGGQSKQTTQSGDKASEQQWGFLCKLCSSHKISVDALLVSNQLAKETLTKAQASKLIEGIKTKYGDK